MTGPLYIENVSKQDCIMGWHLDPREHPTALIQICDLDDEFATPYAAGHFVHTLRLKFADVEDPFDMDCIGDGQATQIARVLRQAKQEGWHVVVHCFAGICRSGAVAEVGTLLGFEVPEGRFRLPNVLVKRKLMTSLGLQYKPELSPLAALLAQDEDDPEERSPG